ncbi:tetratricopeptide repeat protein [Bradyrhizobium sp. SYSU BS000235]|uniref:tetratricopeptide repeat protein n=1 Tax=Bradyrhizobium sp. SYSU BS000235 TaxID=3411332 RepID=UPI003C74C32A
MPSKFFAKRKRQKKNFDETIYLSQLENLSKEEWDAILSKEPREAARWIYAAATYGHLDAQLHWAQMLLDGIGTERDPEAAFRWFGIAARSKRADAINMLGRCHELGWGTPPDFEKAAEHYRESAAKSSDWARFNLGCLLLEGKGVARDTDEAFRLFMSAVEQGHIKSLNMVGRCYENGWGCTRDPAEAVQWFRRSAEAGDFRGQYSHAQILIEQGRLDDALPWLRLAINQSHIELCREMTKVLSDHPEPRLREMARYADARAARLASAGTPAD